MISTRNYSRILVMIGFCLIMSILAFLSPEVRAEDSFGLWGGGFYTTLEPGEINEMIGDVQGWVEDMEADLAFELRRSINEEVDDVRIESDVSEVPMHKDEIEGARGFNAGLSYAIPNFAGRVIVMGGSFSADSTMEGNIEGEVDIISRDTDEILQLNLSGESENEVELSLHGGYAGVQPDLTDNITLTLGAGYHWGEGEVYHKSEGILDYIESDYDSEELNDVQEYLDAYDDAEVEYSADLDFTGSIAARLGLEYSYPVTDSLSLSASGLMRILEMEVERKNQTIKTGADTDIFNEYYQEEFDFELPSSFDEDLGGFEAAIGINFEF